MNSKATYSGASLAAGRATHGGQVSGKESDKDRHADTSGLGAGRGIIIDCLETLTADKLLPENRPKWHRKKSRRPDNWRNGEKFLRALKGFITLEISLGM